MPDEKTRLQLQIAHVLFIDIVGYSKLLIDQQTDLLRELNAIVSGTRQFCEADGEGKLIRLPTGDGMALVFRDNPEAPAQCALQIAQVLKSHPHIQLRMGIHSGPVNEVLDVNQRTNITGAGINIAQRVMDCGDAGHILLSKRAADDLAPYRHWQPHLHEIGECEVKHGVRLSVVNLYNEQLGNAAFPEKFQTAKQTSLSADTKRRPSLVIWVALLLIFITLAIPLLIFASAFLKSLSRARSAEESRTQTLAAAPEKSIVVLPFENASGNADTEYLSDGLSEALINSLSELPQLKVVARSIAFRYKGKQVEPQAVGRELKVRTVLMGLVRQLGDRLNVQVDLVDAETGAQLWGEEYERKLADVLAVKQELAREVTEKLRLKPTGEQQQRLVRRDTTSPEAYQFYLKGRYYWNKRTAQNVRKATDQFQQAADRDPTYALAYAGLADCWVLQEDYIGKPANETYSRAKAFAERALQFDGSLAEPHASLGFVYYSLWEWEHAEEEFKRAMKLDPNYSTAPHWYTIYLLSLGRIDEAMAAIKRAGELDPLSATIGTTLSYAYFAEGDVDAAIAQCKRVIDLDPNYPRAHEYLGLGYLKQEHYSDALPELQKAVELSGRERRPLRDLGYGYAISGKHTEAISVLKELEEKYEKHQAIAQDFAAVYAGLGDKDQSFAWLERDFQAHSGLLAWIRWTPAFDSLHRDQRYLDLLRRMGLQP